MQLESKKNELEVSNHNLVDMIKKMNDEKVQRLSFNMKLYFHFIDYLFLIIIVIASYLKK